ncbi:MAG: LLM class flavin-dependent oxidoreductase [Chloroflexi bacterium]|nr:LLM class flavin-dependent oxidoreductase [Chloroflexota bacterium]
MKIGVHVAKNSPDDWESAIAFAIEAERLGVDSIWVGEAWGYDGATSLAYIASHTTRVRLGTSIMKIGARSPALTAGTAMALASMTGDRFVLGLGTSTPQIMEAWDGVDFARPIRRTRELIEIIRLVESGERVVYNGQIHHIPLRDDLRPMHTRAGARRLPIYIAAVGPQNLRLTGELADGWIGNCFVPETSDSFFDHIRAGAGAAGRSFNDIELQVPATLEFDDDLDALIKRHAVGYAFTFGAMGEPGRNFYVEAWARQGFPEVREVHRLWIDGKRGEAQDLVPLELARLSNLLGTNETVKDRLRAYRDVGVDEIRTFLRGETIDEMLADLGRLMDLVAEVDAEPASGPADA